MGSTRKPHITVKIKQYFMIKMFHNIALEINMFFCPLRIKQNKRRRQQNIKENVFHGFSLSCGVRDERMARSLNNNNWTMFTALICLNPPTCPSGHMALSPYGSRSNVNHVVERLTIMRRTRGWSAADRTRTEPLNINFFVQMWLYSLLIH